jgi:hypothetical protein
VRQRWVHRTTNPAHQHYGRVVVIEHVGRDVVRIKGQHASTWALADFTREYAYHDTPTHVDPQLTLDVDLTSTGDDRPLREVRAEVEEHRSEGTTCPACGQYAKVYHRKINAMTARILIAMYRKAGDQWVWLPGLPDGKHGDTAKARYWGLIEQPDEPLTRDDGSARVGWWRLTELGVAWVRGEASVPSYALVYNGELLTLDDTRGTTSVMDALGRRFDYTALMADT